MNVLTLGPGLQFQAGGSSSVRKVPKNFTIEARLHFDSPVQIQLFHARLGCFVPFLEDFGHGSLVNLNELLQFVQVAIELLEAFKHSSKIRRCFGI